MAEHTSEATSRLDRRKARTRAALVRAAQSFLAAGKPDVPILDITQAADVGLGSFYNHFDSKEQLFRAAVDDALGLFAAVLDEHAAGLDDPAHVFAQGFRLTGRLHRAQPELSRVLLNSGPAVLGSDTGLVSRARRDIEAAARAGRLTIGDPDLALAIVAGAQLCLGQLLHDQPDRDDAQATDQVAEDLLRMFGVPAAEARQICQRPLPDPGASPATTPPRNPAPGHPARPASRPRRTKRTPGG
jgi:AcrR family transcriptional regulator